MVVRSVLMSGGNAKKNISVLYTWIAQRVILPFSPAHALKIDCAWPTCKMCGGKSGTSRVVRSPWCVIMCWRCVRNNKATRAFRQETREYYSDPERYNDVLDHPRIAKKMYGWRSVLRGGHGETAIRRHQVITHERDRASRNNIDERYNVLINDEAIQEALNQRRDLLVFNNRFRPFLNVFEVRDRINYLISKPMFSAGGEQIGPFMTHEDIFQLVQYTKHAEENGISTKVAVDRYLCYKLGASNHVYPC